jgi:hypothetical protein
MCMKSEWRGVLKIEVDEMELHYVLKSKEDNSKSIYFWGRAAITKGYESLELIFELIGESV